ncbi:peptide deformylase [Parashewanella spongiae]|uniref:Peptide deformylase n=1 Tax=Parashewanella spongiae TaxID=342950 RepID=A0A3A6U5E7_9GAMM|nr:peptide deformylase [Parashewanella spongiae]MCL1079351.1 peptide deformylase [Parashewanella spongiae]RJY11482.1 peptide deformylase [Parashewanella spongiae]
MTTKTLPIAQVGENILTQKAVKITEFDHTLVALNENMMATMIAADGLGIAAPQVFSPLAMFIMASRPTPRYPNAPLITPTTVINPQIISHSKEMLWDEEGCLSLSGQRLPIARYASISVRYQNLSAQMIEQTLNGFPARVFQHENDHLQGITVLERAQMPEQAQAGKMA